MLVYDGSKDWGLSTKSPSGRSAVGVGNDDSFLFFLVTSMNIRRAAQRFDAVTLDQFADLIVLISKESYLDLKHAINMEGYSYPFVSLPKSGAHFGVDQRKNMASAWRIQMVVATP
jgi:hypothetical protein